MRKSILKTTVILAVVSFSFLTFSCDKPLSSSLFDQQTVETSRKNAMVTITLNAGAVNSSLEAEWKLGNEKVTTRTLTGVIGTPLGIDNPTLYGYACAGWTNDDIPGDTPKKLETFPEESGSYTAVWGDVVKALRLQRKRIGLEVGENTTFNVEHLPSEIVNPFLFWTSSNPNAVEVTQDGKATVKAGAAVGATSVIRVEAASGEYAECEIIVIETDSFFERIGAYTVLPSYTSSTGVANTGSNYVSFGSFPQSLKSLGVQIYGEEDGPRKGAYVTIKRGGMKYYLGTDNCWYAEVTADPNGFEAYNDGREIMPGEKYYFKVEPIIWRVVTTEYKDGDNKTDNKLLLAEKGLENGIPFYSGAQRKYNNSKALGYQNAIYEHNWEYSNMRAYLNGTNNQFAIDNSSAATAAEVNWSDKGFLQIAFTEAQQEEIKDTKVNNGNDAMAYVEFSQTKIGQRYTWYNYYRGNNTVDKIFLLAATEISAPEGIKNLKNDYGFPSCHWDSNVVSAAENAIRKRVPTDYAIAKNVPTSSRWALRSPAVVLNETKEVAELTGKGAPTSSDLLHCVDGNGNTWGASAEALAAEISMIVPALCYKGKN